MVLDQTRSAAWFLLTDLEWNFRYYTAMSDRFQWKAYFLRLAILSGVFIEASLAFPLAQREWGWFVLIGISVGLAGLAIWDALNHYGRDSGILKLTALVCDELKTEANRLWRDIEAGRIDTDGAEAQIASIYRRWEKATDKVMLTFDNRLSEKCEREAQMVMERNYATSA